MRQNKWSIPTVYRGIKFRSKLEADYARWFDSLHILYAYEPEGFCVNNVCYAPDFWLPELKTVFEVKGVFDENDTTKMSAFAPLAARHAITTIVGMSPAPDRLYICRPSPQAFWGNPYLQPPTEPNISYFSSPTDPYRLEMEVAVYRCDFCGHAFFCDTHLWFACQACGRSDGDHHLKPLHDVWVPRAYDEPDEDMDVNGYE
jgi:hypothetical protein